ncbi:MAG: ATP-binding protein [Rikenellaceae bacterium]
MKSVYIKNYKNLNDFKIESLSRVNLIVGKNSVGKSNLLEAISIFAGNGSVYQLYQILKSRIEDLGAFRNNGEITSERELSAFLPLINGRSRSLFRKEGIEIGDESGSTKIYIGKAFDLLINNDGSKIYKQVSEKEMTEEDYKSIVISYLSLISVIDNQKEDIIDFGGGGVKDLKMIDDCKCERCSFEHITSKCDVVGRTNAWSSIALSDDKSYLIEALNIINGDIEDFNMLPDEDSIIKPYVKVKGYEDKVPLNSMGDGVQKLLIVVMNLIKCKDGIFLIDEIENGLHYSVQTKLWEMIFMLSAKLNIQIFATTHSDDCIKGFAKVNSETKIDGESVGRIIRLDKINDAIIAKDFDSERLDFIANEDIDIR